MEIIKVLALMIDALLLVLMAAILFFSKDRKDIVTRYYIAGICFMLLNMIAIFYGGHA